MSKGLFSCPYPGAPATTGGCSARCWPARHSYSTVQVLLPEGPTLLPVALLLLMELGMVTWMPCEGGTSAGGTVGLGV